MAFQSHVFSIEFGPPAGDGSPGFPTRNTVTLPPIDAHKQQNNIVLAKRRTDSEESFARKLDNMLLLPGGANAEHLQTPRVEKRSRSLEQCTRGWAYFEALGCANIPTPYLRPKIHHAFLAGLFLWAATSETPLQIPRLTTFTTESSTSRASWPSDSRPIPLGYRGLHPRVLQRVRKFK